MSHGIGSLQATFAATLVDEWVRAGLTHAVVCPGSRSTPLARAVLNDGRLRVHVRLDERSAGFFAVGLGAVSGRPAVVVTTSGTAAVELHPAVVEAHLGRVPLIVCTADRPPSLHDVGAPQTVAQDGLYRGAVRWAFSPGLVDGSGRGWWRSVGSRSVSEAWAGPNGPGPVHLNLAFQDPLVGEPGDLPPGRPGGRPWHRVEPEPDGAGGVPATPAGVPARVSGLLRPERRGVVVAGGRTGDPAAVLALGAALGWPVLADPRSGARTDAPVAVGAADAFLRVPAVAAALRPEVVVRVGESWASKVVNTWLGESGAEQILVDPFGRWIDPERTAGEIIRCPVANLVAAVAAGAGSGGGADSGGGAGSWLHRWQAVEAAAVAAIDEVLGRFDALVEPAVARTVYAALPAPGVLVVSSSMPVRDLEWYGGRRADPPLVVSNRGANGIDGVVSTVLGAAWAHPGPCVGLLGDLAFLHDAGALLGAGSRRADGGGCTLVVVDNNGGGIFSFLPQAGAMGGPEFETLFGTPHGLDLEAVARAYGLGVRAPTTVAELAGALGESLAAGDGATRVIVVRTDRAANVAVHDEIHAAVAAAVAGLA